MTDGSDREDGPTQRVAELGVALAMAAFGGLVVFGSVQVGIGWGAEGPRSGFFPFYVGLIIVAASLYNAARALSIRPAYVFATYPQLRDVGRVLLPATLYVLLMPYFGLYLSSVVLMTWFMAAIGGYRWPYGLALSTGLMVLLFVVFEKWFLVALPKGPVEDFLGL
jgi:hypothetical protein